MKNISVILGVITFASFSIVGCVQNSNKEKLSTSAANEIKTKEKKFVVEDSIMKEVKLITDSSSIYNFDRHSDILVFWDDFKKAIISKDIVNTKKMCVIPIPSYYYDSKDEMNVSRLFEKEFILQIKKISKLKKVKIKNDSFEITQFNLKTNNSVYQLEIDGWEYSGAALYFTIIDGKFKLVGVQSYEAEG